MIAHFERLDGSRLTIDCNYLSPTGFGIVWVSNISEIYIDDLHELRDENIVISETSHDSLIISCSDFDVHGR